MVIKEMCRAVFVLPLSAGNFKRRNENGQHRHDGSIAALIMVTSLVAMISESMYTFNSIQHKDKKADDISRPLQIVLNCIGIACCVIVAIREKSRHRFTTRSNRSDTSKSLKLKFLYLFSLGCIVYRTLKLAVHAERKYYTRKNDSTEQAVLFDSSTLLFYMVQTVFIHFSSRYEQFTSSLGIFYCLIMIVVTNISSWMYYATRHGHSLIFNISDHEFDEYSHNNSKSITKQIYAKAKPFIEPMLLEYPLLCLMLITELWPEQGNRELDVNHSNELEDIELTPLLEDTELTSLLEDQNRQVESSHSLRRTYLVLICATVISLPRVIFELLRIFGNFGTSYFFASSIINIVEHCFMFVAVVWCFHLLSSQCQPLKGTISYSAGDLLLILSFLVSTGYFTMHLIPDTMQSYHSLYIIQDVFQLVFLYFQTVFILQMKKYTIAPRVTDFFSIRYLCLFVGLMSFGYWFSDTFLVVENVYKFRDPKYTVKTKYAKLFWFPFVMFYRFECFICYYSLYKG